MLLCCKSQRSPVKREPVRPPQAAAAAPGTREQIPTRPLRGDMPVPKGKGSSTRSLPQPEPLQPTARRHRSAGAPARPRPLNSRAGGLPVAKELLSGRKLIKLQSGWSGLVSTPSKAPFCQPQNKHNSHLKRTLFKIRGYTYFLPPPPPLTKYEHPRTRNACYLVRLGSGACSWPRWFTPVPMISYGNMTTHTKYLLLHS